jgi:hypothetical protein
MPKGYDVAFVCFLLSYLVPVSVMNLAERRVEDVRFNHPLNLIVRLVEVITAFYASTFALHLY